MTEIPKEAIEAGAKQKTLYQQAQTYLVGAPDDIVTVSLRRIDALAAGILAGDLFAQSVPLSQERWVGEQLSFSLEFAAAHDQNTFEAPPIGRPDVVDQQGLVP
jgi:hypothetical protein